MRHEILYNEGKRKLEKKKKMKDKTHEEYDFERNKKELTFAPQIWKSRKTKPERKEDNTYISVKPKLTSLQPYIKEDDIFPEGDDESPILFLDVNFGNGEITRIVMYENDTPEELADAFCNEHALDSVKKVKLIEIIQNHLESMLDKIDEASEDEFDK